MNQRLQLKGVCILTYIIALFFSKNMYAQDYSWQQSHSTISETGNLEWSPELFQLQTGSEIRYIDYVNGSDANDGLTTTTPWKHHPWDSRAEENAANDSGVITYVFKRGVTYRCYEAPGSSGHNHPYLEPDESGMPGDPIRLTSSPDWGNGEAIIAGAIELPANWQKATPEEVPSRMDTTGVWYINTSEWFPKHPDWPGNSSINDVTLYEVISGETHDLHIARDPNWQEPGANFATDYWHQWDGWQKMPDYDTNCSLVPDGQGGYEETTRAYDNLLEGYPCDYFDGGTIWSHYASFMGTPTGRTIEPGHYNPDSGGLQPPHYQFREGTRYMIENLPQYLDTVNEYYYVKKWNDTTGRIFLRLSGNRNPNDAQIEMSSSYNSINIQSQSHIHISGLTFTRNGFSGNTIEANGTCTDIAVTHCTFDHIANNGINFVCDGNDDMMDSILIANNDFYEVKSSAIKIKGRSRSNTSKSWIAGGELHHVDLLRNRVRNVGFRHNGNQYSNVPGIYLGFPNTAEVAGNIIHRCFGSGLVVFGGKEGNLDHAGYKIPLTRIIVHHNKIEHAALGVNDYGGLALWQGGPIYSYCNISGNAVGHLPGGLFGSGTTNLSYPLYLDGAFKLYNFNNILWAREHDPLDIYSSTNSAYFNVFGFMNQFINNTIVGTGSGFGGTSGNRNDLHGNLMAQVTKKFVSSNHGGNPSLIGGGDDASSGLDGAGSLAYTNNVFHGDAIAGTLLTIDRGAEKDIESDAISIMSQQMQDYPLRCGFLGMDAGDELPIRQALPKKDNPSSGEADFRPTEGSPAIDNGINYFIPWSLYATVGEWHFNRNHRDPEQILDYHFYMTEAYFHRSQYYKLPAFELTVDTASIEDYVLSPSEDWTNGALLFTGNRSAVCSDSKISDDIRITINDWWDGDTSELPPSPWTYPVPDGGYDANGAPVFGDGQVMTYPAEYRRTLDMDTCNMLIEAVFRIDSLTSSQSIIAQKHDGNTGYKLSISSTGTLAFGISSSGTDYTVNTTRSCPEGQWLHVIAEVDRKARHMNIYFNGSLDNENDISLPNESSLSNNADFIVGNNPGNTAAFFGAIDFLRICQGTLEDAQTTIDELYEWQSNGPVKYDFAGNAPKGRRDVGALESGSEQVIWPEVLLAWDFEGEGDTTRSVADYYHNAILQDTVSGMIKMGAGVIPESWAWPDGFTFKDNDKLTLAEAIAAEDYIEFSICPKQGKIIDLDNLVMNMMTQQANKEYALFTDKSEYISGNEIASDTLVKGETKNIDLNEFKNITDTLTFRIYYFGVDGGLGGVYGKNGYDLIIEGEVKSFFEITIEDSVHQYVVKPYGTDPSATETLIGDDGKSLHISGNGYKKVDLEYEVTPCTKMEFDYSSLDQGSIQGFLFDNDNLMQDGDKYSTVQLYGTEDWVLRDDHFYDGNGNQDFAIPLGKYFRGSYNDLVFISKDYEMQLQEHTISNIRIYEDTTDCYYAIESPEHKNNITVYPTVVNNRLNIQSDKPIEKIKVYNTGTGNPIIQKHDVDTKYTSLLLGNVSPGIYFVAVWTRDGHRHVVKFIKVD